MFSRTADIFTVLAIIIAPIFAVLLPKSITGMLVASHVELKDAVLLSSVAVLATAVYLKQAINLTIRLLSRIPFYRRIDFNYIYLVDGTVIIRNNFDYINGWERSSELPREDLIWHKRITKNDLFYRFYQRGKLRDRSMTSDQPTIINATPGTGEHSGDDHRYSWVPTVFPPLGVKESISFVVEIMAMRTETAAFKAGTKLGFGVNIPTSHACVRAHAPFGYRFVLLDPSLTVRRSDTLAEVSVAESKRPKAIVSPDGSLLSLDVRRPMLNRRYWVHYRFQKLGS